jgi:hypothetical protein
MLALPVTGVIDQDPLAVALVNAGVTELTHTDDAPPAIGSTVGKEFTVKEELLVPVPIGVVTLIVPVLAPAGRVAVIWVGLFTTNVAVWPLKKVTAVAPVKSVPVITTDGNVPIQALVGEKPVIAGAEGALGKLMADIA